MEALKTVVFLLVILLGLMTVGLVVAGGGDGHWEDKRIARVPTRQQFVFDWLVDPEHRVKWIEGLQESHNPEHRMRKGSRLREVIEIEGERYERTLEVTELVQDKVFAYSTSYGDVDYTIRYELSPLNTARKTRLEVTVTAQYHGLWRKLFEPVLARTLDVRIDQDLETLATKLATLR